MILPQYCSRLAITNIEMRSFLLLEYIYYYYHFSTASDQSHIPDHVRPAYETISENLNRIKQTSPVRFCLCFFSFLADLCWFNKGNQRLVDDLERRINPLFDALNCDSLSKPVVDQLLVLTEGVTSLFL